jgi:membrane-associated phospholipid phosphatase
VDRKISSGIPTSINEMSKRISPRLVLAFLLVFCGNSLAAIAPAIEIGGILTGAAGIGVSEFYKAELVPDEPRWKTPPAIDAEVRSALKWSHPRTAATLSDIMLVGVILPGAFLAPLGTGHDYRRSAITIGEATVMTGVITQVAKFSVARARPYAYYGNDYSNPDSKLSFFSGHTSYSFALSLSSAMIMAESLPAYSGSIYGAAALIALVPAYLRIAADKHYLTDVLTGAIVGMAIAYGVTKMQFQENSIQSAGSQELQFRRVFVLQ